MAESKQYSSKVLVLVAVAGAVLVLVTLVGAVWHFQNRPDAIYEKGLRLNSAMEYEQAFSAFEQAAKQGHADAQHNLGFMYEEGQGTEPDYDKAIYWYKQAAQQDNPWGKQRLKELGEAF